MCGLAGALLLSLVGGSTEDLVQRMAGRLRHRGPDAQSVFRDGHVALGFSRLSIVDPLGGHQPVLSEGEDVVAICNGEIYNHVYHRQELELRGHRFNSGSDAEVIPHLYQEYG